MYLAVGTLSARYFLGEQSEVKINSQYLEFFSETKTNSATVDEMNVPEIVFEEIRIPEEKRMAPGKTLKVVAVLKEKPKKEILFSYRVSEKNELPFAEMINLFPVYYNEALPVNLVSLYKDLEVEKIVTQDEVSTKMAKTQVVDESKDLEPEFFDYEAVATKVPPKIEEKVEEKKTAIKEDLPETYATYTEEQEAAARGAGATASDVTTQKAQENRIEEVSLNEIVAFDYSKAKQDVAENKITTVSNVILPQTVTTQNQSQSQAQENNDPVLAVDKVSPRVDNSASTVDKLKKSVVKQQGFVGGSNPQKKESTKEIRNYPSQIGVQVTATNLKVTTQVAGFELRFQDDLNETKEDFGTGEVLIKTELATPKMTRPVTVLKRGYAPTSTELILEEGATSVVLPLIDETSFNELIENYEARGPVGAVLVELDDETEAVEIDVPYGKIIYLDGDMKKTASDDYRYQLIVGAKAGNALLSYKTSKGEVVSKIIHIHERELTFEANYYENVSNETLMLMEEDLLSKEKAPLIIPEDSVREFATNKTAKKLNDRTYKMSFARTNLGARRYLELNHQSEPIFLGFRDAQKIEVPAENLINFILSRFENSKLGNRCLVQVNLNKKVSRMEVGSESVASSLNTYVQVLDRDGKFYDSVSEKTHKIIVVGENDGADELSKDSKINIKIEYQDGSEQFLSSYCSPNTYLVEQL